MTINRLKHDVFSIIHILVHLYSARVLFQRYYINYTFLRESKDFKVTERTEFILFSLYVKKLLSNDESPTWNGILVIFVSSNDVRPRWKFQPESHCLTLSRFPSLCTTVDVISECDILYNDCVLIVNTFVFLNLTFCF